MSELKVIAHIRTDFPDKFGIPRQSGLIDELTGIIVFEPEYRTPDALKGITEFTHLWLLWQFEGVEKENWKATVRPPRLGGNETRGVFATRSPFRPNPIGLSCVKLVELRETSEGTVIVVSGIDMRDNTPIYDIKPYLAYVDSRPESNSGFADNVKENNLKVVFPPELLNLLPIDKQAAAIAVLEEDPRPHYQSDPDRKYGVSFAGKDIRFTVDGGTLTVFEIV